MITDPSGAAVSGAAVTATNLDTGLSRETQTDQAGSYRLFALPVGRYELRVKKEGFTQGVRTEIRLAVAQEATVDLSLQVGKVSEQV